MISHYIWKGKPVSELTADELREWLRQRPQLFTHSVDADGTSLSIVNPELKETESAEVDLPVEFARVAACVRCRHDLCPKLVRDATENVPSPGYIGRDYARFRVLLIGQNPALCTPDYARIDAEYTLALRHVRDQPNSANFAHLQSVLERYVPKLLVYRNSFALDECDLTLEQVAYCQVVRCRTTKNSTPSPLMVENCRSSHLERWLDFLAPTVVIFVGKWAWNKAEALTAKRGIPSTYINRDRMLTRNQRAANHAEVAKMVRQTLLDRGRYAAG